MFLKREFECINDYESHLRFVDEKYIFSKSDFCNFRNHFRTQNLFKNTFFLCYPTLISKRAGIPSKLLVLYQKYYFNSN